MSDSAATPEQRAAVAAFLRSPRFYVIAALDVAAIVLSFVGYLKFHTVFAFAPMVVMMPVIAFVLLRVAQSSTKPASTDPLVK
jgi:hypothetical protein